MKRIGFLFALSLFAGQLPAQQQYCVENDITHAYLNDFTYDTVSLDKSFVMKYFNMPHDYRLDAPRPVELTWTHQDGAESQTVEVSESADFTNAIVFALDKDTARYELYNLAPGRKYYYRIVSVKSGTQTTGRLDRSERLPHQVRKDFPRRPAHRPQEPVPGSGNGPGH